MAKKKLNLDEIMGEVHTVAELSLMLTGQEVLGLAKLVRYVLEHPYEFDDEESAGETGDIVNTAQLRHSLRNGLGLCRALPGDEFVLSPSLPA